MTPVSRKEEERAKRKEMCLLNTFFTFTIQLLSPAAEEVAVSCLYRLVIELKKVSSFAQLTRSASHNTLLLFYTVTD